MRALRWSGCILVSGTLVLLLPSCSSPTGPSAPAIDTRFIFEVQVLDKINQTLPVAGVPVYLKSYKFIRDGAKGLFEWTVATNQDGWAVAYPGYNVQSKDQIVFKASLDPFFFPDDATASHVVYGNVKPHADESNKASYTVTLFLYR